MPNAIVHQEFDPQQGKLSYYTYEVLTQLLFELVEAHPQLATIESIGKSLEGREIWLITLTNQETGPALEKPAYWIDGNTHAGEVTGSTVALYTIWSYLTHYGQDEKITRLLDRTTFYILPRLSVDGAERYLTTPYTLRSSTRPYPYDDTHDPDGLYPEDIDGDGEILMMRVPDPNGVWKSSRRDARIMRRREIDEEGETYYHLMTEGIIRNYDGYLIPLAPRKEGLDINRNYPYQWAAENEQSGAGAYPFSEPETRAEAEFWRTHTNISGFASYHTTSGVLLRPYSTKSDDEMLPSDLEVFKLLGERSQKITDYPAVSTYHGFRYGPKDLTKGAMDDYAYDHLGWFGFTVELWDLPTTAGIGPRDFIPWMRWHPEEDDIKLMQWNDEVMQGEAFEDWRPFEHPQLGPVEIGGWKSKLYRQNAPLRYLPEMCEKHSAFTLMHASLNPYLSLYALKVEQQAEQIYRITAIIENNGFLPTDTSAQARERRVVRPIQVTLSLPEEVELLQGKQYQEVGQLEGRSNKLQGSYGRSITDHRCKVEWTIKGPTHATLELTVQAQRAGVLRHTIILENG
ncbi:M14 family metallopeptidase [Ktedonobacter racemifer]|uniref:Peptidase M14 carboxypeptidase A n=1 Tax=Ktedonobacter racemifer DSM 44963 TaxID=485913 RepID=D6TIJ9_KTERA|nr:M14 family metallopeptidase [Ktedonobacter racemifer]EFH89256.1 peptidase M14 carboxypeptidase A [Ktedonobacter racemifer DSM 44963]